LTDNLQRVCIKEAFRMCLGQKMTATATLHYLALTPWALGSL